MKNSVLKLKRKSNNIGFPTFKLPVLEIVYDWLVN